MPPTNDAPRLFRTTPVEEFQAFWSQGVPIVVTGVGSHLQGSWTSEYFINRFGEHTINLVDCDTELTQQSTVADIFTDFGKDCGHSQVLELTVSVFILCYSSWDCPKCRSQDESPELFKSFWDIIPFEDFSRLDGALNMAAHFPVNSVAPDLGESGIAGHAVWQMIDRL